jgi:dipeptidyl aminopeptidase/acylaminoacyl peptidase
VKSVTGLDPRTDAAALAPYCPLRNVTKDYPPTMLIHGTADSEVPHDASVEMDRALARASVEHRLILIPGAGHDFVDGDPKQVADAYAAALEFVERHMKPR